MNTANVVLMQQARASLRGKWGVAVGGTFIIFVISLLSRAVPFLGLVIGLVISGPLALGAALFWLALARGQVVKIEKLFEGFNNFGTGLAAYLLMTVFIILWSLLLIIPGIVAAFSYAMTFFILADDPSIGALDALHKSKVMMRGHKWKLFLLSLRFIGWAILALMTLGIGLLWLVPYMQVANAKFYDDIRTATEPELAPIPTPEPMPGAQTAAPAVA